jgi:seryl-tRNA synthetase
MREIASVSAKVNTLLESLSNLERQFQELSGTTSESDTSLIGMTSKVEELKGVLANLNAALIDSTGGLKDAMLSISEELENRLRQSIENVDRHTRRMSESVQASISEQSE